MASQQRSASMASTREKTYFEQQREELMGEIAMHVLANINKLNRSLEAVTAALWSQFENVMAKEPEEGNVKSEGQGDGQEEADRTKNEGEA
ncbi:Dolichyl-diphosphooligosaccharide-protein glycosyltransferase subunit dad1 [Collariella sp. IMI 366227]|nr:Dolichyl-diphosphooligosaccharide-protein glycosyltransferase subunit dad1 [Collariella sp. IMI 366227]